MINISLNTFYNWFFNEKAVICCFVHWKILPRLPHMCQKDPRDWSHAELHSPTLFIYLGGQLLQWHLIVATWIPSATSILWYESWWVWGQKIIEFDFMQYSQRDQGWSWSCFPLSSHSWDFWEGNSNVFLTRQKPG